MKVALYFIFFVGFMAIVTVIDKYSKGPLLTQFNELDQNDMSMVDASTFLGKKNQISVGKNSFTGKSTVTSNSQFGMQVTKAGSNKGRTSVTAGSRLEQTRVTSETKFKELEKSTPETESREGVVTADTQFSKSVLTGKNEDVVDRENLSDTLEVVYKGDEYKVYTLEKGKLVQKESLWFDYLNPPSKKLRDKKFNALWKDQNCCFWKNGKNYETVVNSNLFRRIGEKKIPVK